MMVAGFDVCNSGLRLEELDCGVKSQDRYTLRLPATKTVGAPWTDDRAAIFEVVVVGITWPGFVESSGGGALDSSETPVDV